MQCSVVTAVLAFVAERGASNIGGPVGEPNARFVRNPPGNPNADAVIEGANGIFRRIANNYAEDIKAKHVGSSKSYLSYWYGGPKGEIMQEINALMNSRPVSSLGYQTPADVLAASS